MNAQATVPPQESSLASTITRLATAIGKPHYPTGDRAAIRRWAPRQAVPLAFYRLWLRHADAGLPSQGQTEVWQTIVWCMVTLGESAHTPSRRLGQALAESRYSEGRLERLLSAPDEVRPELLMSAVRFLAAKGECFDLVEAAQLLLTTDEDRRESVNRRIAEAFYRYLPKNRRPPALSSGPI